MEGAKPSKTQLPKLAANSKRTFFCSPYLNFKGIFKKGTQHGWTWPFMLTQISCITNPLIKRAQLYKKCLEKKNSSYTHSWF